MSARELDRADSPMTFERLVTEAAAALDDRRRSDAMAGIIARLYMWVAPSGADHWGGIAFAPDHNLGDCGPGRLFCKLATPELFPQATPYGAATRAWIYARARRLPLLPHGVRS